MYFLLSAQCTKQTPHLSTLFVLVSLWSLSEFLSFFRQPSLLSIFHTPLNSLFYSCPIAFPWAFLIRKFLSISSVLVRFLDLKHFLNLKLTQTNAEYQGLYHWPCVVSEKNTVVLIKKYNITLFSKGFCLAHPLLALQMKFLRLVLPNQSMLFSLVFPLLLFCIIQIHFEFQF